MCRPGRGNLTAAINPAPSQACLVTGNHPFTDGNLIAATEDHVLHQSGLQNRLAKHRRYLSKPLLPRIMAHRQLAPHTPNPDRRQQPNLTVNMVPIVRYVRQAHLYPPLRQSADVAHEAMTVCRPLVLEGARRPVLVHHAAGEPAVELAPKGHLGLPLGDQVSRKPTHPLTEHGLIPNVLAEHRRESGSGNASKYCNYCLGAHRTAVNNESAEPRAAPGNPPQRAVVPAGGSPHPRHHFSGRTTPSRCLHTHSMAPS
mmetsp:Transcript_70759/g.162173  ORF Transcript_70759/g.162173 Transcript_70759/m.162173 type:complete len:257 (+) Transcript_70759:289-1059(+)